MLTRLQKKTLIPAQLAGYALTLLVGVAIVLLSAQVYSDIKPMLTQQTSVLNNHAVTISKKINVFKTLNKDGIYFSDDEIKTIQEQPFVKNVARFNSSLFHTSASIKLGDIDMSTELFFESIPDQYIDADTRDWRWNPSSSQIPIIIPEDYLKLYNFGFAESQSLPVLSKGAIEKISFNVYIDGISKYDRFKGRIVGFSNKINTILVPEEFLNWANQRYGEAKTSKASHLLVEFSNASDERIPAFIENNGYDIKRDELESSKMFFLFRSATAFLIAIALIIIMLSVTFIIMSLNLIIQKNKDIFVNLYNIGYSPRQIARFYQRTVSIITVVDMAIAAVVAIFIRNAYIIKLKTMFEIAGNISPIIIASLTLTALLIVIYNIIILRSIKTTVEPKS